MGSPLRTVAVTKALGGHVFCGQFWIPVTHLFRQFGLNNHPSTLEKNAECRWAKHLWLKRQLYQYNSINMCVYI